MAILQNSKTGATLDLTPIRNLIIFQFEDESTTIQRKAAFQEKTAAGILYKDYEKTVNDPRWGKVLAVGPKVIPDIQIGSRIFIEALGWTTAYRLNGLEPIWFTDDERVIGVEA